MLDCNRVYNAYQVTCAQSSNSNMLISSVGTRRAVWPMLELRIIMK